MKSKYGYSNLVSKLSDQKYLKEMQYKTPDNLNVRINLHRKFGTNPYGWHKFVIDQLNIEAGMTILEVGCGPGGLWIENRDRIPGNLSIYLADISSGMLRDARKAIGANQQTKFDYLCMDVQAIPLPDNQFELVFANHMLYHVPDIPLGVREISRALMPGGLLCAATNGRDHMCELHELIDLFYPGASILRTQSRAYSLENALEILGPIFDPVDIIIYNENLKITAVEPILEYLNSLWAVTELMDATSNKEKLEQVGERIARQISTRGHFWVTKSQGVIIGKNSK